MEGRDDDVFGQAPCHAKHTLVHFTGRLVGECYRQDIFSRNAEIFQKMDNPGGDYLRLAGTGAGQDQQGAIDSVDGALLWWVEFFHGVICVPRIAAGMQIVVNRVKCEKRLDAGSFLFAILRSKSDQTGCR